MKYATIETEMHFVKLHMYYIMYFIVTLMKRNSDIFPPK